MNEESLILQNVGFEIAGRELFTGLGVCLPKGSLLVVKGENGSGKSSLLSLLAGISKPQQGEILYKGESIYGHESYTHESLFVSHRTCLKPELTVRENIRFWQKMAGDGVLVDSAIHYFDLEPYVDFRCSDLSMGWQQRVSLARLLYIPAHIWILDEPTSHLDDAGIALFNSLVISRVEQGGIVIMTTHAQIFTKEIKVIYINDFN